MAKNAMQNAWEYKRKEGERLQKLKSKKQQNASAQEVKAEAPTTGENETKA